MMSPRRTIALFAALVVVPLAFASPTGVAGVEQDVVPSVAPVAVEVKATVISRRHWISDGALYIVGEIENTSASTMNGWVQVGITPGHNGPQETLYETVAVSRLAPGGRSPFLITRSPFGPTSTSIGSVSAGGYVTSEPKAAIGVSIASPVGSDPSLSGGTGDGVLIELRNSTTRSVRILDAIAAFRDAAKRVSNVGRTEQGIVLAPGETIQQYAQAGPSGILATSATVDIVAQFADGDQEPVVSWGDWFHDLAGVTFRADIVWLAETGITAGCAPFRFCPSGAVTRAQMAMFLDRALDLPSTTKDFFSDDNGKTGEASINRLAASGITGGCASDRFCPTANVTRGQMAAFLVRAFALPGTATDYFTDDETSTFESSINRVAAAGITGGCGGTKYCPLANVTRGQMAAFLRRALA